MSTFAKRLKELRTESHLTQQELADKFYLNKSSISRYEQGKQMPEIDQLQKLAEFFDVSIDYLLGKTNIRKPEDKISTALTEDPELLEFWSELRKRPELQLLFKQTRELSDKDIRWLIRIIKTIEDEEDEIYG